VKFCDAGHDEQVKSTVNATFISVTLIADLTSFRSVESSVESGLFRGIGLLRARIAFKETVENAVWQRGMFFAFQPPSATKSSALLIFAPHPVGEECDKISVCLSVCSSVREHISETTHFNFTKFSVRAAGGCGSVLVWRRCSTLCISGFADYVTFADNLPGKREASRGSSTQRGSPWDCTGLGAESDVCDYLALLH